MKFVKLILFFYFAIFKMTGKVVYNFLVLSILVIGYWAPSEAFIFVTFDVTYLI